MTTHDGATATADGLESLLQPWQQLTVQLCPLIGDSGFCALYGRSARLAGQQFSWLMSTPSRTSTDVLLDGLRAQFAAAGPVEAGRANALLLTHFKKLLTGLIGEALTMQILDAAPAGRTAFQPVQEQKQ